MIARDTEKWLLQATVAIACLVPLWMGAESVVRGVTMLRGVTAPPPVDLDSHFRYLSGIFLVLGMAFAATVPGIEAKGARFRLLGAMVIGGGLARLVSLAQWGPPGPGHLFGFAMELGVVPLLLLWQARVAWRFRY